MGERMWREKKKKKNNIKLDKLNTASIKRAFNGLYSLQNMSTSFDEKDAGDIMRERNFIRVNVHFHWCA